ncbi:unnamed protein product, partial [Musa textilis]
WCLSRRGPGCPGDCLHRLQDLVDSLHQSGAPVTNHIGLN